MALEEVVAAGVRNAFARNPVVDREGIERSLRRANRSIARRIGPIEWIGSLEAYIRQSAELLLDGWTVDSADPLTPPQPEPGSGCDTPRFGRLLAIERELWRAERAAHNTSRLTPSRRLPVYLNAIEAPALASDAAGDALGTAALAATVPPPRKHGFATGSYWKYDDDHWGQTRAVAALPASTRRPAGGAAARRGRSSSNGLASASPTAACTARTSRPSSGPTAAAAGTGRASPSPRSSRRAATT